jgi:phospholipid/cholesterol/gamma-HCH transport system ATP-binding protein
MTTDHGATGGPPEGDRSGSSPGDGSPDEGRADRVRQAIRDELATDESVDRTARGRGLAATTSDRRAAPRTSAERRAAARADPVIALENVSLAFERPVLEDISLEIYEGETVVIVGESGTGKSTMLKLVLRLLVPDEGRVLIKGRDIVALNFEEALKERQQMGMVFQSAALFDSMSVFDNVAYPLREHTSMSEDEIEQRVREKLRFVDLDPDQVMTCLPAELSGGMKKRVGIARGIANNPAIMLYDEPTSGLDPLTTGTITRLIMKLQRELGVTSLVVSHDIRSSDRMASYIAVLANQRIEFFGTPEEMAASDDRYIQDFLGGF